MKKMILFITVEQYALKKVVSLSVINIDVSDKLIISPNTVNEKPANTVLTVNKLNCILISLSSVGILIIFL